MMRDAIPWFILLIYSFSLFMIKSKAWPFELAFDCTCLMSYFKYALGVLGIKREVINLFLIADRIHALRSTFTVKQILV